jgi:hypothetical protein
MTEITVSDDERQMLVRLVMSRLVRDPPPDEAVACQRLLVKLSSASEDKVSPS